MPKANTLAPKCGKCGGHPSLHAVNRREIKTERGTFKLHAFVN